jgi:signal transduction histidine kinase
VQDLLKVVEAYQSSYSKEPAKVQEVLEEVDIDFVLEDLPRIVDSMKLGSARISELVLNLRNFYRLDEREMKASDLHEGIESTLVLLHNRYKRKIEIVKQFGDIQLVECHINQLNQVFMNLLANAIDALLADEYSTAQTQHDAASLHQKQITITTQQIDAERVAVRITDNGSGIPVEVQNRVFEPLFTTKPRGIGTGLGLSIAHQIVTEKHHGQIYCCSTPGEGTTFVVEVPICQPRESRIEVDTESRILTASV